MKEYSRLVEPGVHTKFPFLISFAYIPKVQTEASRAMLTDPDREVLLDSGAFTAFNAGREILLADYLDFLHEHSDSLFGYMMLDKLQDPVTSALNHKVMINEGLSPVPIHVFGDDQARMDELFESSRWVALGGLRRPHRGAAPLPYVAEKMRWAAGRHVHWLGYTKVSHLAGFNPFSSDCASFTMGRMFGTMAVYLGRGKWWSGNRAKWKAEKPRTRALVRAALATEYDIDPSVLRGKTGVWNTSDSTSVIHDVSMFSWIRYIYDVRFTLGVRLFLASQGDRMDETAFAKGMSMAKSNGWNVATQEQADKVNQRLSWGGAG